MQSELQQVQAQLQHYALALQQQHPMHPITSFPQHSTQPQQPGSLPSPVQSLSPWGVPAFSSAPTPMSMPFYASLANFHSSPSFLAPVAHVGAVPFGVPSYQQVIPSPSEGSGEPESKKQKAGAKKKKVGR